MDVRDFAKLDHASLRALVSANAESLRLLRTCLARPSAVTMDFPMIDANQNLLQGMSRLVRLFVAEGRLLEMDNRPSDAAQSYVDSIRFGNELRRGGFLMTHLWGVVSEAGGCHSLALVASKLTAEDFRSVIGALEKIDSERVKWQQVLRNEKHYTRNKLGNRLNPNNWWMCWQQARKDRHKAETTHKIVTALDRLVTGDIALRLYTSKQGQPPARLDEVMPGYLSRVPEDPFTGKPMVYRPQGTNWLLYSVGPDGVDDGGSPAGKGWPVKGDLLFDSTW